MRAFKHLLIILLFIIIGYLLFYPTVVEPYYWNPPKAPSLDVGEYKTNSFLKNTKQIDLGIIAPEDIAIDQADNIYTGVSNGNILQINPKTQVQKVFATTKGEPLGLKFDNIGNLIVADAKKGLLSVNTSGKVTLLTDSYLGKKFKFTDDLDISKEGVIYFSDASTKYSFSDKHLYSMENGPTGRFYSYNPKTKETKLLLKDLFFSNGVSVDPSEEFLLLNETLRFRVLKYWLKGPKAGKTEIFIDNLPGIPDGILSNGKDIHWLAILIPRNKLYDLVLPYPFIRKIIARIPPFLVPSKKDYGFVLGLDKNGKVIHNLQDPKGTFSYITNVVEHKNKLYFGSLEGKSIGIINKPNKP